MNFKDYKIILNYLNESNVAFANLVWEKGETEVAFRKKIAKQLNETWLSRRYDEKYKANDFEFYGEKGEGIYDIHCLQDGSPYKHSEIAKIEEIVDYETSYIGGTEQFYDFDDLNYRNYDVLEALIKYNYLSPFADYDFKEQVEDETREAIIEAVRNSVKEAFGTMFFVAVKQTGEVITEHMQTNMHPEKDDDYVFSVRIKCNNDVEYDEIDSDYLDEKVDSIMEDFDLSFYI